MPKRKTTTGGIVGAELRGYIERIERLNEEKAALGDDIRAVFAEAKARGFDPKTMRKVVRLRKLDQAERDEQQALLDVYLDALGMRWDSTPLAGATKALAEAAE